VQRRGKDTRISNIRDIKSTMHVKFLHVDVPAILGPADLSSYFRFRSLDLGLNGGGDGIM
jgi:hypothetical protein